MKHHVYITTILLLSSYALHSMEQEQRITAYRNNDYLDYKKTGNNLTHVAVFKADADGLYELIQKKHVSNAANKHGETPMMMALRVYQKFTQHPNVEDVIATIPTVFYRTRCCLFMLMNYTKKEQGIGDFTQCCNKHII